MSHLAELGSVTASVGHLVSHDQVVLGIDRRLHVVADHRHAGIAVRGHGTCIGVSQRDLTVRRSPNLLTHTAQRLHLLPKVMDLDAQPRRLLKPVARPGAIVRVQGIQVALDVGFDLSLSPGDLAFGVVALSTVDRLELAAVDCDHGLREELQFAAQHDKTPAHVADALAAVAPEVGDGLEVGGKPTGQPHQFEVSLAFTLQAPARLDAVEVPVDVDLEQHRRMVGRPTGARGLNSIEAELLEIQFLDEGFNHPDRVVISDVVVQALRHQTDLASLFSLDESLHVWACS